MSKRARYRHCLLALLLITARFADASSEDDTRIVREAVQVARDLLTGDNFYDRISGAGTLVDIGDPIALDFLLAMIEHPDHSFARAAIDVLLSAQHPAGIDAVLRIASVGADGPIIKYLSESLANRPYDAMVELVLVEILVDTLSLDDIWIKKHVLQALIEAPLGEHEDRILQIAQDESQDPITRAYASFALLGTAYERQSLDRLVEISSEENLEAREAAAVALGRVDSERTRAALRKMHGEKNPYVKLAVLASEAGFRDETAINALINTIIHGGSLDGPAAAASLRRLPVDVATRISDKVTTCCGLASDVAARLVEAWAWIDASPAKIVEWGLAHTDTDVRMQTVWLIGQREARKYLDVLVPLLKDHDSGIRAMAAWSVVRLLADAYSPGTDT